MGKFDGCCIWREPGAVNCYYADRAFCYKCGWNPAVEDERKEKLREMMRQPTVETYSIGRGSIDPAIKKTS